MNNKLKYIFYKFISSVTLGKTRKIYIQKKNKYKSNKTFDIMSYECNRKAGQEVRENYAFESDIIGLIAYQTLNKIKEIDLKRKVREGKKVKVCFLLDDISKFSAITTYQYMIESNLFEPFLVLYNSQNDDFKENQLMYEKHIQAYDTLKQRGYVVFNGYDENKNFIPIEQFKPDIVFMTAPYLDYHNTALTNIFLNINYLVCYLNYALNTVNNYDYHYNNRRIASCWKYFVETREDYNEMLKYSKYCGSNAILTGYPKLDDYAKLINECKLPTKLDNGNPIVIYAPHHSIRNNWGPCNLSTFHLYYKYFLDLVKKYPEINFVFKPHPNLITTVDAKGIMSKNEYQQYIETWNSLPNGLYVYDGEYVDLFRRSDLLIQDSGSFIAEWLPTNKPCMYLINPERNQKTYMDGFSILGRKILDKYYLCHNQEEIDKYFKMIMFDKQDPMKEERIKLKDELFINIGCAGQKIVEYLEDVLTN